MATRQNQSLQSAKADEGWRGLDVNSTRANLMNFESGSWVWSTNHGEFVRILDVETVWNYKVCQVWSPRTGTVERVSVESLSPAPPAPPTAATGIDRITYAVSAARIVIAERTGGAAW